MILGSKFALQARWVVPIESPPIAGGVVTIEGERIVDVGTHVPPGVAVQDLGDVVLLPGLVNAHTHLEFSNLTEPLGQPGMSLPEWVPLVIAHRKRQLATGSGVVAGVRESLQQGVTSMGEIATSSFSADDRHEFPDLIAFQEVIGFSAARVHSVYDELVSRLDSCSRNSGQGISPHAPYTIHPILLERLVLLASKRKLPVAMHLAESPEELQLLNNNQGSFRELLEARSMWDGEVFASGRKPLDYLKHLSRAPRSLVVHGNYLSQEEIEYVAEHGERMSIVFCPRTHAFFGHADYPLSAMFEAGVRVAVGTDSRASNPDLSLLKELRFLAQTFPDISPEQILVLGTINGAEALGVGEWVGTLVAGKLANLTAIDCNRSEEAPLLDVLFSDRRPRQTWLRGRQLSFTDC